MPASKPSSASAVVNKAKAPAKAKKPDVYTPNAFLDVALTILYVGLSVWTVHATWYDEEPRMLKVMLVSLVFVALFAEANKIVFNWLGKFLSRNLFEWGLIEADVMNGHGSPERLRKWMSQAWQLAIHVSMTGCELYFLAQFPHWWSNPLSVWFENTRFDEVDIWLKSFYILQQSIWMYTCFVHVAIDDRRKDYYVMYIHHCVTMALIILSFTGYSHRVGFLVMYIHDVSDIFIDSMKMINYLGLADAKGFFLTEFSYVATMVSWAYYRLWEFPSRVIWAASSALPTRCPDQALELSRREPWTDVALGHYHQDCVPGLYTNITLLWTLFVLHCWWFFLLTRIGILILTEDTKAASTKEYEGDMDAEGEEAPESKKTK